MNAMLQLAAASRYVWFKQRAGQYLRSVLPGIAVCMLVSVMATAASHIPALQAYGASPLVLAMVIGIAASHLLASSSAPVCMPGIAWSKQKLLRLGIILYGFRLTLADIGALGWDGVFISVMMLVSTFILALLCGCVLLKMDRDTVLLVGAGSAICGAAAVLATQPVLQARAEKVTVAVATVVLFGTLATFVYPFLYSWNLQGLLPWSASAFGIYIGSTVHEVAQVVAAARMADPIAVDAAVIAKMVRIMLLPLFLIALSLYMVVQGTRRWQLGGNFSPPDFAGFAMPWFAIGFLCSIVLNSALPLPRQLIAGMDHLASAALTMAMAALGLTTHLSCLQHAGIKPVLLAGVLFFWLVLGGAWINRIAPALF